jgi:hypothetical protein
VEHVDPPIVDEAEYLQELRRAVRDAWRDGSELVRQHAELASQEAADRSAGIAGDAAVLVAGVLCLHAAVLALLTAVGFGLYRAGAAPWAASLAVALLTAALGAAALFWAKRRFLRRLRQPSETLLALRETGVWVEEMLGGTR